MSIDPTFAELLAIMEAHPELFKTKPLKHSAAADAAYLDSVTPGTPVTDPEEIRRLFAE